MNKRRNILLVEDEYLIAKSEANDLEKYGYHVTILSSGEKAVAAVGERASIDLILMDINLGPGMDGTEAAQKILENNDIPIVFLSSHTEPEIVEKTEKISSFGYVVKNSGMTVLDTSIKMAFRLFDEKLQVKEQRIRLEEANDELQQTIEELEAANEELSTANEQLEESQVELRASEEKYRSLYNSMSEGMCLHEIIYDDLGAPVDYRILDFNPVYEAITGIGRKDGILALASELYGADEPPYMDIYCGVAETGIPVSFETYFPPMDKHFFINVFSPGKGKFATVFFDITDQKKYEDALIESEAKYKFLLERLDDIIWTLDMEMNTTYVSPSIEKKLGFTPEERMSQKADTVMTPESFTRSAAILAEEIRREQEGDVDPGRTIVIEIEYYHKNGTTIWFENIVTGIRDDRGVLIGLHGVSRDISERKKAEEELDRSLKEKGSLLRELQHRIKNTLSMIESLVSLQLDESKNSETRNSLGQLRKRLESISGLYSLLAEGKELTSVNLDEYLRRIIEGISALDKNAEISYRGVPAIVPVKLALSLGLICNELVTNSLKHSSGKGASPRVDISMADEAERVCLVVENHNRSLPDDFDIDKAPGLGLKLVKALAMQHEGECTVSRKDCRFTVVVKKELSA